MRKQMYMSSTVRVMAECHLRWTPW